jgi:hypothetical protein
VTRSISAQKTGIPLYLIPQAVARWIRKKGDAVYRISIKRTHWHHYNVSVRTKAIQKELRPLLVAEQADAGPGTAQGKNRRCAV